MNREITESSEKLPHGNCYAVVPGRLIAGEYPARFPGSHRGAARSLPGEAGGVFDTAGARLARQRLEAIIRYGVTDFVDLTREEDSLEPYDWAANLIAEKQGRDVRHTRFPIYDGAVPASDDLTFAILDFIDKRIKEKGCVYLHCWGGIGRTGTIVGCFLVRRGVAAEAALGKVEYSWRSMNKYDPYWTSPENELQKNYVRCWQHKERQR
jgi:protein-tyrosine phosphatase